MWFPKFPYTNFSQINLDWVLKQVKELSEWMNRYFKDIRQDLDDEINNRIEGDKALGERIDQEIQDRAEADTALGQRIDKEIQDRTEADTALGQRIDQEIQDRTNADTALGQRIDTEISERKAADQQLQNNIDAEEAAREAADTQLRNSINALRSDAILKDGSTTTTAAIPFAQGIKTGSIAETTPDTGVSIEAQLDLNSHKITALADGTDNTDAVNVGQLEAFAADVHSIPAGGSSGQVLAKVDGTNYNVTWVDQQGGGSGGYVLAGGTTGQVLAKSTDADYQTEWVNVPAQENAITTDGGVQTVIANTNWGFTTSEENGIGLEIGNGATIYNRKLGETNSDLYIAGAQIRSTVRTTDKVSYISIDQTGAEISVGNNGGIRFFGDEKLLISSPQIEIAITGTKPEVGQVLAVKSVNGERAILEWKTI